MRETLTPRIKYIFDLIEILIRKISFNTIMKKIVQLVNFNEFNIRVAYDQSTTEFATFGPSIFKGIQVYDHGCE